MTTAPKPLTDEEVDAINWLKRVQKESTNDDTVRRCWFLSKIIDAQAAEIARLKASVIRDIDQEDRCPNCGGTGTIAYGSTATWRGGIGGATITEAVCNVCWGSGHKYKPWPSRWEIESRAKQQAAESERLRAGLRYYALADPEHWHNNGLDGGERARELLK